MLADRLLCILDYDTEKEVHFLELLKLRFGELSLHNCEIMIRDISDAKRINNHCSQSSFGFNLDSTIVSYLFWPSFRQEKIILPQQIIEYVS
jgi:anaphase-promoting complex subunit 2